MEIIGIIIWIQNFYETKSFEIYYTLINWIDRKSFVMWIRWFTWFILLKRLHVKWLVRSNIPLTCWKYVSLATSKKFFYRGFISSSRRGRSALANNGLYLRQRTGKNKNNNRNVEKIWDFKMQEHSLIFLTLWVLCILVLLVENIKRIVE